MTENNIKRDVAFPQTKVWVLRFIKATKSERMTRDLKRARDRNENLSAERTSLA